ncbi:MAG: His-Xaa-Ser system radical SAM maturase HxsB [Paludibacteraceae bacterium]|nr:His-Xaa-Ser system radical SAM maturase HxsB [Paludibacteraceae bacterium]
MRNYALLPFNFITISNHEVLINELGDFIITPIGTARSIIDHAISDGDLYKSLVANFFITEEVLPSLLDIYASRLRTKKGFLDDKTSLHIFVLTLRCNQNCTYCQASSQEELSRHCSMSIEDMTASVQMMFLSPSPHLTMEFQGGEPSLEIDLIRHGIETAEEINKVENRKLTYVLCTNCRTLSDELLELCKQHSILISTSLDGPSYIHNNNRGREDSYEKTISGINKARCALGNDAVSALMTTSELALDYPKEIVDEYVKDGFNGIFLRALNPYGLAAQNDDWKKYNQRFVDFYKKALDYIIELNMQGLFFREEYASIILRKMLTPYTTGFVDLQSPAGTINSVIVYNYDGYVYASDESRMLAEVRDFSFRLGKVTDRYEEVFCGSVAKKMGKVWANEALAGCSSCPIKAYCGADPVRHHSTQGDMYGFRPTSMVCEKNKAIIKHLLSLIVERGEEVLPIFRRWVK